VISKVRFSAVPWRCALASRFGAQSSDFETGSLIKATHRSMPYIGMRQLRALKQDVWYEIHTAINNREPLFRLRQALALFRRVLNDTRQRFVFEMTGFRLEADRLTFYIKPADGLGLPDILKWMKQTFAVRYNRLTGRTGHIWGDRYWSVILEGEPPEEVGWEVDAEGEPEARVRGGVRPRPRKMAIRAEFPPFSLHPSATPPP
jgi:REP element-mobilizing transposase RayT